MTGNRSEEFSEILRSSWKFELFLLRHLPAGYFAGLRVTNFSAETCTVMVPFKWFNKNPFRSTYFAVLAMAAELSTGVLAMASVRRSKQPVSMLVTRIEGDFLKKAHGKTRFTCNDGYLIDQAVLATILSGEGQIARTVSTGVNASGEKVAEFSINWSFKLKKVS